MSQGWHFRPYAPELLQVYNCRPFTERGDRRVAFGVVVGPVDGVQVTAFDYQRRTKRTSYSGIVYSDTNQVVTVWVVKLPANLPSLHMATRGFRLLTGNFIEPRTPDVEFNKGFLIEGGDENFAMQLFTPQVMAMMKHTRLADWTIQGNELIHYSTNHFTRTTAEEIMQAAQALVALVRSFPEQLWRGAALPPSGQMPSQPIPMPMPMPMTGPQPMPITGPPVPYPPQQMPPGQPMPMPQMQPPPPGYYPPQPGYGPAPGWPHPQYGPPHH